MEEGPVAETKEEELADSLTRRFDCLYTISQSNAKSPFSHRFAQMGKGWDADCTEHGLHIGMNIVSVQNFMVGATLAVARCRPGQAWLPQNRTVRTCRPGPLRSMYGAQFEKDKWIQFPENDLRN